MSTVYEDRLSQQMEWALSEGSRHFEEKSGVHQTLHEIARRLDSIGVPYAIVGGMALFFHGFRRFTEDVDVLVTADGLQCVHEQLEGLGYIPLLAGSKNLRDTTHGVRIVFLVTGEYAGDGKPKPVAFPNPIEASFDMEGVRVLSLNSLIELKLASGMTNPGRLRDLADVQELIRHLNLTEDIAEQLDPSVREEFRELWRSVAEDQREP